MSSAFKLALGGFLMAATAASSATSPRPPCEPMTLADGSEVLARKTKDGWSTLSCELQVTIRLTDRVTRFEVQPGATSTRCTVWVNDKNGTADNIPKAWDACVSAMLERAESEGEGTR